MSIARELNKVIRKQLLYYAAWMPAVDPFEVGDYGYFRKGVFERIDNIRRFGIEATTKPGTTAPFEFESEGVRKIYFAGGAEVPNLPDTEVEAEIRFQMDKEHAFKIIAKEMKATAIDNMQAVADHLAQQDSWNHKYKIIRTVYTASGMTVLGSQSADTTFSIKGKAKLLKQLEGVSAEADFGVEVSRDTDLKIAGASGPFGLEVFKVKKGGGIAFRDEEGDTADPGANDFGDEPDDPELY